MDGQSGLGETTAALEAAAAAAAARGVWHWDDGRKAEKRSR